MKRKRYPEKRQKKNKYKQRQEKNDITSKNKKENKIVSKSKHDIEYEDYYIKNVRGDGNCYFRCISYYFRESELYYNEYRQPIYELFKENVDKFTDYVPDHEILDEPEPKTEEDILNLLKKYAETIKINGTWSGDYELAKTAYFFQININVLYKDSYNYKSYNY